MKARQMVFGPPGLLDGATPGPLSPHVHFPVKTLGTYFDDAFKFDERTLYVAKFLSPEANF